MQAVLFEDPTDARFLKVWPVSQVKGIFILLCGLTRSVTPRKVTSKKWIYLSVFCLLVYVNWRPGQHMVCEKNGYNCISSHTYAQCGPIFYETRNKLNETYYSHPIQECSDIHIMLQKLELRWLRVSSYFRQFCYTQTSLKIQSNLY